MPVPQQALDGSRDAEISARRRSRRNRLSNVSLQLRARAVERRVASSGTSPSTGAGVEIAEHVHQRVVLLAQLALLLAVVLRHALAAASANAGMPWRASFGKIGAAEEGPLVVVRQEHRERPAAAALREHLLRDLVDAVDVGPLFAIHLDVHEQLVHERARWPRPRRTRAPSRGTSGRPNSRWRAGSACRCARARSALPAPRDTSPPDWSRAAAGTGWFPWPGGSCCASLVFHRPLE